MALRTNTARLWMSRSWDDGTTWSLPEPTEFSDNATKFHFGRLPDGRHYYVGCPDTEPMWKRSPLVLSLAKNGTDFNQHYILADSPFTQAAEGMHKAGDYGYPHTLVHGDRLFVIVSRKKEAVELISIPLGELS